MHVNGGVKRYLTWRRFWWGSQAGQERMGGLSMTWPLCLWFTRHAERTSLEHSIATTATSVLYGCCGVWQPCSASSWLWGHGPSSVVGQGPCFDFSVSNPPVSTAVLWFCMPWVNSVYLGDSFSLALCVNLVPHCKLELWEQVKLKVSCNFDTVEAEGIC